MSQEHKAIRKQLYNIIYGDLKQHCKLDNKEAHRIGVLIVDSCTTLINDVVKGAKRSITPAIEDVDIMPDDSSAQDLDKEAVILKIQRRIKAGKLTKEQELKYIAELNKLQDNYTSDLSTQLRIELVNFLCPVCDGAQQAKERKPIPTIFS